jgi:type IV secretory pathway VirJ component
VEGAATESQRGKGPRHVVLMIDGDGGGVRFDREMGAHLARRHVVPVTVETAVARLSNQISRLTPEKN